MRKKFKLFIMLIIVSNNYIFAQNDSLKSIDGNRIIINTEQISNVKYFIYTPSFKAKAIYKNINQVKNYYPEELMSSILSALSQDWIDLNTLGGNLKSDKPSSKDLNKVKKININSTYFELVSKLEFTANNTSMAIVKFYLHQEGIEKSIAGVIAMQKEDGKWKKTSSPYITKITIPMLVYKADVLGRLLKGVSDNEYEKIIINQAFDNNGLNFNTLLKLKLNEKEKEYLTNPLNW